MMFYDHVVSVSTLSTQLCLRSCCAHLSVVELGTYDVHDAQSQDLCVLVYKKQQLVSWDLQYIASSFLLKWTQLLVLLGK